MSHWGWASGAGLQMKADHVVPGAAEQPADGLRDREASGGRSDSFPCEQAQ
jgi:hypothetical protein